VQYGLALLGLILPLLAGCSLESPKSPRWTVNLTVPLANRHYDIPYIIEHADQPELIWDSVSGARFEVERTLDTIFIGANITFADLSQSYSDSLGLIALRPSQTLTAEVSLAELYSGPVGDIPAFSTQLQKEFSPLADVEQAEVSQGTLRVEVTNMLGLALDSLQITIENVTTATEIGRADFPGTIQTQEKRSVDLDLAGKVIRDRLRFTAYIHTPGGYLDSTAGRMVRIAAYFPDSIFVTSATAVLPLMDRTFADTIDFSNDIQATRAVFQSGQVDVEITNESNLTFDVQLRLPGLTRDGLTLGVSGYLEPNSSEKMTVDLQNTTYENPGQQGTPLCVEVGLHTPGSSVPVQVSAADRFTVWMDIKSPVLESVTGILPPTVLSVDGLSAELNLPEGFENVGLASGELQLEILSSLAFPGEFSLELTGGRSQTLSIAGDILPATAGEPITSYINVANAATLLHPIPAMIFVAGTLTYGDGTTSATVWSTDFFVPSFTLIAPLSLYLNDVEHIGETEGVELFEDNDELAGRLGTATISVEFENHLPFGVTIEIRLADDRDDLPDNPDIVLGPTEISPGVVDADGRTIRPVTSSDVFTISDDQADIFAADSVFVTEEIHFFSSDSSVVTVQDSDYIHWRALLQIETALGARD